MSGALAAADRRKRNVSQDKMCDYLEESQAWADGQLGTAETNTRSFEGSGKTISAISNRPLFTLRKAK